MSAEFVDAISPNEARARVAERANFFRTARRYRQVPGELSKEEITQRLPLTGPFVYERANSSLAIILLEVHAKRTLVAANHMIDQPLVYVGVNGRVQLRTLANVCEELAMAVAGMTRYDLEHPTELPSLSGTIFDTDWADLARSLHENATKDEASQAFAARSQPAPS